MTTQSNSHYGFKRLTAENWRVPDHPLSDDEAAQSAMVPWTREILAPQLLDAIPEGLRARFEAARGSSLYGWFFYPQYALALAEVLRVLTVAIEARCIKEDTPSKFTSTVPLQVQRLESHRLVTADEAQWFATVAVSLRDSWTHGFSQATVAVGEAVELLDVVARMLNAMFTRPVVSPAPGAPPPPFRVGSSKWDPDRAGRYLTECQEHASY